MKVLIVGGGIAGLSLGIFLEKLKIDYEIIEKEKEFNTLGYFLAIWPNGMAVVDKLGLKDKFKSKSIQIHGLTVLDGKGKTIIDADLLALEKKMGHVYEIERADFHKLLVTASNKNKIKMGTSIKSIKQNKNEAIVELTSGEKKRYDLVIGADGIESRVRRLVYPLVRKYSTGHRFWLYWLPPNYNEPENIVSYVGGEKYIGIYPTKSKKNTGIFIMMPCDNENSKEITSHKAFLKKRFKDMSYTVQFLIDKLPEKPDEIFYNDVNEMHIPRWYKNRILFIGDAAHATSPIMGMGASMALEDAYVLAQKIKDYKDYKKIFQSYYKERYPRVNELIKWSKALHMLIALPGILDKPKNFLSRTIFLPAYIKWQENFCADFKKELEN